MTQKNVSLKVQRPQIGKKTQMPIQICHISAICVKGN
jgi:hypothetical protein